MPRQSRWGDPDKQIALIFREDLDEPLMRQWIVERAGRAFAYGKPYPANAWPQPHLAHLSEAAEKLLAEGASVVVIDPARDNYRARRADARAGFIAGAMVQTEGEARPF